MKLATYTADGQTRTGIVVGDRIIDSGLDATMIDLIREWDVLKPALETKAAAGGGPTGLNGGWGEVLASCR